MECKWLLMWLLFGLLKGKNTDKCPVLPAIEFADVTAEMYPLQTKLYYKCDPGYDRKAGAYLGIQCESEQQGAVWKYEPFKCFDEKNLSSTDPMMELELTQKPEREPRSSVLQKQENLSESRQKDFCGPPKAVPHASIRLPQQHYVGQVLHFKCQTGYDKRPPTFGSRTCEEVNGEIVWTPLDMRCTNDSNQWPPQTIGTGLTLLSSSPSSSGTLPVTDSSLRLSVNSANHFNWNKKQKKMEDFSENCGIQMQTHEINDLPQKKPDCTSDPKTSSGKRGGSWDTQIQSVKEAENVTA